MTVTNSNWYLTKLSNRWGFFGMEGTSGIIISDALGQGNLVRARPKEKHEKNVRIIRNIFCTKGGYY